MKFCVTIARYGYLLVEADGAGEAADIANHQMTDTVNWSDDWAIDSVDPAEDFFDPSDIPDSAFITEKAFE